MPRRSRAAREVATQRLTAALDRVAGSTRCVALQVRDTDGTPAMLLMGDSCSTCRLFRSQIPPPPPPPPSTDDGYPVDEEI
jgi:hypothetical protein